MDEEGVAEDDGDVVGSAADVFAFDFEFCPAAIEGVFELRLDD